MNKLKQKRLEGGLRQIDLARLSGLSLSQIWNLEQGLSGRASKSTRDKILTALNAAGLKVKESEIFLINDGNRDKAMGN